MQRLGQFFMNYPIIYVLIKPNNLRYTNSQQAIHHNSGMTFHNSRRYFLFSSRWKYYFFALIIQMADGDRNKVDELPVQMSPFSHSRWDEDEEQIKRRRQQEFQNLNRRVVEKEVQESPVEEPVVENPVKVDNFLKEEVLPRPAAVRRQKVEDLSFDIPAPPNLFPVIKFPERRGSSSDTRAYKEPSPTIPVPNAEEQIKLPPKIVFRDVLPEKQKNETTPVVGSQENLRIYHYGASLPLWPA